MPFNSLSKRWESGPSPSPTRHTAIGAGLEPATVAHPPLLPAVSRNRVAFLGNREISSVLNVIERLVGLVLPTMPRSTYYKVLQGLLEIDPPNQNPAAKAEAWYSSEPEVVASFSLALAQKKSQLPDTHNNRGITANLFRPSRILKCRFVGFFHFERRPTN